MAEREALREHALDRYLEADARWRQAQDYWEACGSPLIVTLPNGIETIAPELKVLLELEAHADRLYRSLPAEARRPGRPVGAQSAPDRQPARRSKLRAVPEPGA